MKEVEFEDVKWIHVAENRAYWQAVINSNEPSVPMNREFQFSWVLFIS